MQAPIRVRIQRKDGRIVQDSDVYAGRRWTMGGWDLPQSIWANPYPVKQYGRDQCLAMYWDMLRNRPDLQQELKNLAGKRIGCFCDVNEKCHVDSLIVAGRCLGYW